MNSDWWQEPQAFAPTKVVGEASLRDGPMGALGTGRNRTIEINPVITAKATVVPTTKRHLHTSEDRVRKCSSRCGLLFRLRLPLRLVNRNLTYGQVICLCRSSGTLLCSDESY